MPALYTAGKAVTVKLFIAGRLELFLLYLFCIINVLKNSNQERKYKITTKWKAVCMNKNRGSNVLSYFQRLIGIITLIIYSINNNNNNHTTVSSLNSIFRTFKAIKCYGVTQLRFSCIPSTRNKLLFRAATIWNQSIGFATWQILKIFVNYSISEALFPGLSKGPLF